MIIWLIIVVDLSNRIWFKNVDNSCILKLLNICIFKFVFEVSYSILIIRIGIVIIYWNLYNYILMKNKLLIDNWIIDG